MRSPPFQIFWRVITAYTFVQPGNEASLQMQLNPDLSKMSGCLNKQCTLCSHLLLTLTNPQKSAVFLLNTLLFNKIVSKANCFTIVMIKRKRQTTYILYSFNQTNTKKYVTTMHGTFQIVTLGCVYYFNYNIYVSLSQTCITNITVIYRFICK